MQYRYPQRTTGSRSIIFSCTLGFLFLPLVTGCAKQVPRSEITPPQAAEPVIQYHSENWDVIYLGGVKAGHAVTRIGSITEAGRQHAYISNETHITVNRSGNTSTQRIKTSSVETDTGELIRCESTVESGSAPLKTIGKLENSQLRIEVQSQGASEAKLIPWENSWGGYFAVEQSLRNKPMKPGEKRTVKSLHVYFNQAGDTDLQALEKEETTFLAGTKKLLKIKSKLKIGKTSIEAFGWCDEQGEVLKTFIPMIKQTIYRTTKEIAQQPNQAGGLDLMRFTLVKTKRRIAQPHQTKRITYRIRLLNDDPAKKFSNSISQNIKSIDSRTAEITVTRVAPHFPTEIITKNSKPSDGDLAANNLIQCNDAKIKTMANEGAKNETDPWKRALSLESYVHDKISNKNYNVGFATAAEVAKSLEGDCTEHAVLLAALCRAQKIPARVATGLVYAPSEQAFGFHMWNEVWINDRWIPLDATLGRGGIGAAHLKLLDSNLEGTDAFSIFLPLTEVIGQLELEIIKVE